MMNILQKQCPNLVYPSVCYNVYANSSMDIVYHHLKSYKGKQSRGRPTRRWREELDNYWKVPSGRCGSSKLRPSLKRWTLHLHNNDDDIIKLYDVESS